MEYLKLYIKDIDINSINMKKINEYKYVIQYKKKLFYILPEYSFNSYGIKTFNNIKKITIILDKYIHKMYIDLINNLYDKIKSYIESSNLNIEVINPISKNTLDLEISDFKNNSTKFFEVKDNDVIPINIENISNKQFDIAPIFFLYQLSVNNNKLYFNFIIYECYIKFHKPLISIPSILEMFNKPNIKIDDQKNISNDDGYIF
jgi:hypothetical protein